MRPGSLKEQILARLDIAGFYRKELPDLKNGRGDEATAFCPFHEEHNPELFSKSENRPLSLFWLRC